MNGPRFTLSIEMLSDWHSGCGQGRHRSIDRLAARDYEDLPFIPAATLRGIWRDAGQLLARALDNGGDGGPWARFTDQVFGSEPALDSKCPDAPVPSRFTLLDGRFPESVCRHLRGDDREHLALRQALTFVKPGVSIDRRSGRAKKDFLRFEEVARGGAVLEAGGWLDCPKEAREVAAAFLAAAAMLIERLGGKRRRGMGKCKVTVAFEGGLARDGAAIADMLEKAGNPPEFSQAQPQAEPRNFAAGQAANGGEWLKIPLKLTLLSPLIAADEVQGNIITCQNHIPGATLLPHVARCLQKVPGLAGVWARISDGDVRVLAATPEIAGQRSLPLPLCWEEPKSKAQGTQYRLIRRGEKGGQVEDGGTQYRPLRVGFVSPQQQLRHLRHTGKILRTHNTVKDEIQRPHEDVGGVYTYEALAAGQVFRSEVWIRGTAATEAELRKALKGEAQFGRARQAGYGRVDIEPVERDGKSLPRQAREETLTVWLTSDAILPGAPSAGGLERLAAAIASAAGEAADIFDLVGSWGNLRWRRIEGWQSLWGLPRPSLLALQAGSAAEFKLSKGIKASKVEREGIGERRGEGFGCVVLNHTYLDDEPEPMLASGVQSVPAVPNGPLPAADTFLKDIARRAWERCIALRAEAAVSQVKDRKKLLGWELEENSGAKEIRPNMSQLGALRTAISEFHRPGLENATAWLGRLRDNRSRRDKWPGEALTVLDGLFSQPPQRLGETPPGWGGSGRGVCWRALACLRGLRRNRRAGLATICHPHAPSGSDAGS